MTNENPPASPSHEHKPSPFGARLKAAREAMGLERKEVANQLRLNEKIIVMMERDRYAPDLPVIFIRGYIRAYGKLLQIPDHEIKKAIEPIKQKVSSQEPIALIKPIPVTTGNPIMQTFTYAIFLTIIGLVGMWWYTHNPGNSSLSNESPLATISHLNPMNTQSIADTPANTIETTAPPTQAAAASKQPVAAIQIEKKPNEQPIEPSVEAAPSNSPQEKPSAITRDIAEANRAEDEVKQEMGTAYDDRSE